MPVVGRMKPAAPGNPHPNPNPHPNLTGRAQAYDWMMARLEVDPLRKPPPACAHPVLHRKIRACAFPMFPNPEPNSKADLARQTAHLYASKTPKADVPSPSLPLSASISSPGHHRTRPRFTQPDQRRHERPSSLQWPHRHVIHFAGEANLFKSDQGPPEGIPSRHLPLQSP